MYSEQYAKEKGNHNFRLTGDEFKLFLAILFTSGHVQIPRKRMYWENNPDCRNEAISSAMPRNRFDEILKYLHLSDNQNLNRDDKFAKIRPVFSAINERFLRMFPQQQHLSIDESMIPYFGKHGAKQFIRGKPIRFGYKLWSICTPLGYLIQFEPYQGRSENRSHLGLGGDVVMDLISELPEKPYILYTDNYFTSLKLADALSDKGVGIVGTARTNRIEKCPIQSAKDLKKKERGCYDYKYDRERGVLVTSWNDNSVVTLVSNCAGNQPLQKAKRWSAAEKRKVEIDQPKLVAEYNANMGGVDRMDQNIAQYRMSIRTKKWWWPLFAFLPEAAMQNAWHLYRISEHAETSPLDFLAFRREVCKVYFMRGPKRQAGRPYRYTGAIDKRVPCDVRYDNQGHMITVNPTQRRCALCKRKTTRKCVKCNVGLHDKCFVQFHRQ